MEHGSNRRRIADAVLDELGKCSRKDNPEEDESFVDLGLDILDLCELCMRVELRLDVMLPDPRFCRGGERRWKFKNARELIDYIYTNTNGIER